MSVRQRDVKALFVVTTMMALGEELWVRYFPKFLLAAGGSLGQVGLFGSLKDFGECIFAYTGSAITARHGERRSLVIFTSFFIAGAALLLCEVSPPLLILGALATTAWSSLSLPATFSVLGKNVTPKDLPWAFAIQSIVRRIPIVIGPIIGGWLIERSGVQGGTRIGIATSMLVAGFGCILTAKFFESISNLLVTFYTNDCAMWFY
jgi:MFS family permease